MVKPDRNAFARKNAAWLIPACGAVLLLGIMRQNPFAMGAGAMGLIWVARACWTRK
jgi:hypothetical protein